MYTRSTLFIPCCPKKFGITLANPLHVVELFLRLLLSGLWNGVVVQGCFESASNLIGVLFHVSQIAN